MKKQQTSLARLRHIGPANSMVHKAIKQAWKLGTAAMVLLAVGCANPLDIQPPFEVPTEQALNTTDNLESALNGAYAAATSSNALGGAVRLFPDVVADHLVANVYAVDRGNLPTSLQNMYNRLLFGVADGVWRQCYLAINRANNIIDAIDKGFVTNQDAIYRANADRIKGEALFLRAVMHFELCRLYGLQYGEPGYDDPQGQRGVILRIGAAQDRNGEIRASVKQVYDQVVADLTEADSLMPKQTNGVSNQFLPTYGGRVGGRATKDAAFAYLARVHFQQGTAIGNDSALAAINKVLPATTDVDVLRNLLDDCTNPDGSRLTLSQSNPFNLRGFKAAKETIFQVVNVVDEATGTFNTSNGLLNQAYTWNSSGSQFPSYFLTSAKFYRDAGYDVEGGADLRYSFFTQPIPTDNSGTLLCRPNTTTNKVVAKYFFQSLPAPFDPNIGVVNVVINRLGELLITRAELSLLTGDRTQALADVNALRRRAFGTRGTGNDLPATLTNEQLFAAIRRERIRELAFEGDRLYDLRRFSRLVANGVPLPITTTPDDFLLRPETAGYRCAPILSNINVNDPQLLFQIPDAELSSNPNIRRN